MAKPARVRMLKDFPKTRTLTLERGEILDVAERTLTGYMVKKGIGWRGKVGLWAVGENMVEVVN